MLLHSVRCYQRCSERSCRRSNCSLLSTHHGSKEVRMGIASARCTLKFSFTRIYSHPYLSVSHEVLRTSKLPSTVFMCLSIQALHDLQNFLHDSIHVHFHGVSCAPSTLFESWSLSPSPPVDKKNMIPMKRQTLTYTGANRIMRCPILSLP